ncbi:acyl-CoA carboxylase subunit beta [Corynebacterium sp. zg254]|uniref:Acyl-CoA carboxylase subunit beta n=1 Tax=Corynebacterium zhongnanshanii TaxID=2768834 RepID=A0ABQ6VEW8_9CORY|nr:MULTISPECIES: carboxyl transferase domain-containing protein [Corynebacterium]KAB3522949.1 acyl-CoA carboxylase subunit beta [Corynebacterium zhongnanshanii]MCR5913972.1 acyl-CoA carboxylase subunit beta [Corynebacterium sp. zg254]
MTATPDMSTTAGKIADLRNRLDGTGRPAARERVESLLDDGSFVEIDALARHRATAFGADKKRPLTDGIVSGYGSIDGRPVCVFAQDQSIFEGQLGETAGEKILKVTELAAKSGTPLVALYDGTGARMKENLAAMEFFTRIYRQQAVISGVVPQIAVVTGKTSGAQAHAVALSDVVVSVAEQGTVQLGEQATEFNLSHVTVEDDSAALEAVANILSYLPSNNRSVPLEAEYEDIDVSALDGFMPDESHVAYDVTELLSLVVDDGSLLQLQPQFAPHLVTAFGRVEGRSVAIVANQPQVAAGALDVEAADKAARFMRMADAFNIPIVTVVDTPGFVEEADVVRRTAKLISASANASVGKISLVTRKSFGPAYVAFGAKRLGFDVVLAWPTAEISVADAQTIAEAVGKDEQVITDELINPYIAAERGLVDAVIPPSATRQRIGEALRLLERKVEDTLPRKHDNMPL